MPTGQIGILSEKLLKAVRGCVQAEPVAVGERRAQQVIMAHGRAPASCRGSGAVLLLVSGRLRRGQRPALQGLEAVTAETAAGWVGMALFSAISP